MRRLLILFGCDFVVLRNFDGKHRIRRVRWVSGRPFAAPYMAETSAHLHPGGSLTGPSYINSWLPASPGMEAYFASPPSSAGEG